MTKTSLSSVFCPLSSPLASLVSRLATWRRGRSPRPTGVRAARWSAPTVASLASRLATLRRGRDGARPSRASSGRDGARPSRASSGRDGARPSRLASLASCLATFLLFTSAAAAETAFLRLPPAVYGGVVRDYLHTPYDATNAAGVIVRRTVDAKLLVTNATFNVRQGVNYVVPLPVVSAASAGVVALRYGEKATFSCLADGVLWANLATVTADGPGYHALDITIGHDANGDGIADEYAAYMEQYMKQYGIEGPYDPEADYNHDGVSNRAHYLAGTFPFAGLTVGGEVIAEQTCTISSLMNVRNFSGNDYFAITFNALEEAVYSVVALDDLAKGWGEAQVVVSREQLNGGKGETEHWAEETGEMTLYVSRDPNAKQGFYKLQIAW